MQRKTRSQLAAQGIREGDAKRVKNVSQLNDREVENEIRILKETCQTIIREKKLEGFEGGVEGKVIALNDMLNYQKVYAKYKSEDNADLKKFVCRHG